MCVLLPLLQKKNFSGIRASRVFIKQIFSQEKSRQDINFISRIVRTYLKNPKFNQHLFYNKGQNTYTYIFTIKVQQNGVILVMEVKYGSYGFTIDFSQYIYRLKAKCMNNTIPWVDMLYFAILQQIFTVLRILNHIYRVFIAPQMILLRHDFKTTIGTYYNTDVTKE